MLESLEQFYDQHRNDVARIEKAQSTHDKHLEKAREAGDIVKHPELWDQASAEYQVEAKVKIMEAVEAGNFAAAEELIRSIRIHLETAEKSNINKAHEIMGEESIFGPQEIETLEEKIEGTPVVNETREVIHRMLSDADWKHAKDKVLGSLKNGFWDMDTLDLIAEMRIFDPERFDKEDVIPDHSWQWQRLVDIVENEAPHPEYYLLALRDLKAVNPRLFEEQFWNRMDNEDKENIWKRIMEEVCKFEELPEKFLELAAAVNDLDPERFKQEIGRSEEFAIAWPKIVEVIERSRDRNPLIFARIAGMAQNIKPEKEPDIVLDEKIWNEVQQELEYALNGYRFRNFFSTANFASRLRVEKK